MPNHKHLVPKFLARAEVLSEGDLRKGEEAIAYTGDRRMNIHLELTVRPRQFGHYHCQDRRRIHQTVTVHTLSSSPTWFTYCPLVLLSLYSLMQSTTVVLSFSERSVS